MTLSGYSRSRNLFQVQKSVVNSFAVLRQLHSNRRSVPTYLHRTQICAVCLISRPDDVWDRHSLTSSMSACCSAQLLETERSLWLVQCYGTVCHLISSRATHCHGSVENLKHFLLRQSFISFYLLFRFSFPLWSLRFLLRPCNVILPIFHFVHSSSRGPDRAFDACRPLLTLKTGTHEPVRTVRTYGSQCVRVCNSTAEKQAAYLLNTSGWVAVV